MPVSSTTSRETAAMKFSQSLLCKDITKGIHRILQKKRQGKAPPHDSATQRYHVHVWPERRRNGCWCPPPHTCTRWETCRNRPVPELGVNMWLRNCYRDHGDPCVGCDNIHCFNPNTSAVKYMDNFLRRRRHEVASLSEEQRRLIANILASYRDTFPSRYFRAFENMVHLIFQDLCTETDLDEELWNPEVHGVLAWTSPANERITELARGIHSIWTNRNLKEVRHR
ncbi:hypothetical protein ACHAPI_008902 [Fusarium lateritium]